MARFSVLTSSKLAPKGIVYGRPSNTDFAEVITGQAFSERAGTVRVEECYDLPVYPAILNNYGGPATSPLVENTGRFEGHGKGLPVAPPSAAEVAANQKTRTEEREKQENELYEKWAEEGHWSICTWAELQETSKAQGLAEFAVAAGKTVPFNAYAGAPIWRVVFEAGTEETKSVRVFARAFERGKV
jgi:hypothetical protein